MADEASTVDVGFFLRSGLTSRCREECFDFVHQTYPGQASFAAPCQGYCSFTILVGGDTVVQFRPDNYRLDLKLTTAAREVYGNFAPDTHYVATLPGSGLLVYSMGRIDGVSFMDFRASRPETALSTPRRAVLCQDFARFLARSWNETSSQALPLGTVGKTIMFRLEALISSLPRQFQATARRVRQNLRQIEALPWVLTHGDLVAGNIMVNPVDGRLTGLVDWAEAERLPFGLCFYGLEELLGEMTSVKFEYRQDAHSLRRGFWAELQMLIPDLKDTKTLEAVMLARDLGVLLWHGIAFDDGAIDRVVQQGRDIEEICRLDAFFDTESAPMSECSKL